jgi:hypothetical protein
MDTLLVMAVQTRWIPKKGEKSKLSQIAHVMLNSRADAFFALAVRHAQYPRSRLFSISLPYLARSSNIVKAR